MQEAPYALLVMSSEQIVRRLQAHADVKPPDTFPHIATAAVPMLRLLSCTAQSYRIQIDQTGPSPDQHPRLAPGVLISLVREDDLGAAAHHSAVNERR